MDEAPKRVRHDLPEPGWPSEAAAAASRLFSPVRVGRLRLSSRTWVPAMVPWRATEDGLMTPALLAWYGRFAEGAPGGLVVEATGIRDIKSGPLLRISHDRFLPGLQDLVTTVRERSQGQTKLFIQLIDFLTILRRPIPETYFRRHLVVTPRHRAGVTDVLRDPKWIDASELEVREALLGLNKAQQRTILTQREWEDLEFGFRERVTDLDRPLVRDLPSVLPGLFADAAERAFVAGFDGVELHCAHAYTLASFLSKRNTRSDGYGLSIEGRVRLPLEVLRAVRRRVGDDRCVGVRMLSEDAIEDGTTVDEAAQFAVAFGRAGVDFVSLSRGGKFEDAKQPRVGEAAYPYTGPSGLECMPTVFVSPPGPFGRQLPYARVIRRALRDQGLSTPVIAAGGLASFAAMEAALAASDADIVASARQSLADPDWWLKMRLGRGNEVRRCLFTNYCEGLDQRHLEVTCQLWDKNQDSSEPPLLSADGKRRLCAPAWSEAPKQAPSSRS